MKDGIGEATSEMKQGGAEQQQVQEHNLVDALVISHGVEWGVGWDAFPAAEYHEPTLESLAPRVVARRSNPTFHFTTPPTPHRILSSLGPFSHTLFNPSPTTLYTNRSIPR